MCAVCNVGDVGNWSYVSKVFYALLRFSGRVNGSASFNMDAVCNGTSVGSFDLGLMGSLAARDV